MFRVCDLELYCDQCSLLSIYRLVENHLDLESSLLFLAFILLHSDGFITPFQLFHIISLYLQAVLHSLFIHLFYSLIPMYSFIQLCSSFSPHLSLTHTSLTLYSYLPPLGPCNHGFYILMLETIVRICRELLCLLNYDSNHEVVLRLL